MHVRLRSGQCSRSRTRLVTLATRPHEPDMVSLESLFFDSVVGMHETPLCSVLEIVALEKQRRKATALRSRVVKEARSVPAGLLHHFDFGRIL